MKVLVMGGNRYISLQLVRALVEQGHEVTEDAAVGRDAARALVAVLGKPQAPGLAVGLPTRLRAWTEGWAE
jgi:NAD(P)-dependent dehydrogenase (short-subunit alcohol dehydrogenase family)